PAIRLVERLFDPAGLDNGFDRRQGSKDRRCGACSGGICGPQFVHQDLPGWLGQLVEKPHAFGGIHAVDDGNQVLDRPRVQQDVRVVVREYLRQLGGKVYREAAKQHLPLFHRDLQKEVGGDGGIQPGQEGNQVVPVLTGEKRSKLVGWWTGHLPYASLLLNNQDLNVVVGIDKRHHYQISI